MLTSALTPDGSCIGTGADTDRVATRLVLRPAIRANHPTIYEAGSGKDGKTASGGTACGEAGDDSIGGRVAAEAAFVISLITNLWSGDRREQVTVNRAPLFEHRNSTSLNSTVSG